MYSCIFRKLLLAAELLLCLLLFSCAVPGEEDSVERPMVRVTIENRIAADRPGYYSPVSSEIESYQIRAEEDGQVIWQGSTALPYCLLEFENEVEVHVDAFASDGTVLGSGSSVLTKGEDSPVVVIEEKDGNGEISLDLSMSEAIADEVFFTMGEDSYQMSSEDNILSFKMEFQRGFYQGHCTIQGKRHNFSFRILSGRKTTISEDIEVENAGKLHLTISSVIESVDADYKIDEEIETLRFVSGDREWAVNMGENDIFMPFGVWHDCKVLASNSDGIEIGYANLGDVTVSSDSVQEKSIEIIPLEGPSCLIFVIPGYEESAFERLSLLVDGESVAKKRDGTEVRFEKIVENGVRQVVIKDGEEEVRSFSVATIGKDDLCVENPVWLLELDVENGVEQQEGVLSPDTGIERIVIEGVVSASVEGKLCWAGYVNYDAGSAISLKGVNGNDEPFCFGEAVLGEDGIGKHVELKMTLEEAETGSARIIFNLETDENVDMDKLALVLNDVTYGFNSAGVAELQDLARGTYTARIEYDEISVGEYSFRVIYGTQLTIVVNAFLSEGSLEIIDGITGSSKVSVVGLSGSYGQDDMIEFSLDGLPSSAEVKVMLDDTVIEGGYSIEASGLSTGRHYLKVYVYSDGMICDMTIAGFSII